MTQKSATYNILYLYFHLEFHIQRSGQELTPRKIYGRYLVYSLQGLALYRYNLVRVRYVEYIFLWWP